MAKRNRNNEHNGNGNGNGNGAHRYDVGEPEYFLPALLAADPILYLVDSEGNLIDAEGNHPGDGDFGAGLPPGLRALQRDAMRTTPLDSGADPSSDSDSTEG